MYGELFQNHMLHNSAVLAYACSDMKLHGDNLYCACLTFTKWFMIIGWPAIVFLIPLHPQRTHRFTFNSHCVSNLMFNRFIFQQNQMSVNASIPSLTNVSDLYITWNLCVVYLFVTYFFPSLSCTCLPCPFAVLPNHIIGKGAKQAILEKRVLLV